MKIPFVQKIEKLIAKLCLIVACALILNGLSAAAQTKTRTPAKSEVKFGYVQSFKQAQGVWQIEIDYAQIFEGEAAERAAQEDNAGYSPADLSGIYIRNKNTKIHRETVSATARIYLLKNLELSKVTFAQFERVMRGETKNLPAFWGFPGNATDKSLGGAPFNVTIENGKVTKMESVYFP